MISLPLSASARHVLCLGAHCDDVEIGCGATLSALAQSNPNLTFTVIVFTSNDVRGPETRAALTAMIGDPARLQLVLHRFRDGFLPAQWAEVKEAFEAAKKLATPDIVFTHHQHDFHQDHRIVSELTWNTFRNHLVLEYEIPKYDGDLGRPSLYAPLPAAAMDRKVAALLGSFPSQLGKPWFTEDLFRSLARLRGMECNSPSGYAEAFFARKVVVAV